MKAVILTKHGTEKELKFKEVPIPNLTKNQALIRVKNCGVNFLDIWLRKGIKGRKVKFPFIPGCDISGTLETPFENFKKNEPVVVFPAIKSQDPRTPITILGGFSNYNGGYAEYVVVPKSCVVKKPKYFSFEEASALNVSYLTSWNMLEKLQLKKNQTLLIWGASGGVGTASVMLAKKLGLRVIAVTSKRKNSSFLKKLGADEIIFRDKTSLTKKILEKTNGQGVDGIIDQLGAKTWPIDFEILKIGGKMAVCGITTGNQITINIPTIYNKEIEIFGTYMGTKNQLKKLHKFMQNKNLKPVIDSVLKLEKAPLAHKKLAGGEKFGKIILSV